MKGEDSEGQGEGDRAVVGAEDIVQDVGGKDFGAEAL